MSDILTDSEIADIERFQEQRRRQPVPEDAWLYVAEIDRLVASHRALAADRDKWKEDAELAYEDADRLRAELRGIYGAMLAEGGKSGG